MHIKPVIDKYMSQVPEVKLYCRRCLQSERWDGNVILMIVDASFDSIGLNYFHSVVPKVEYFRQQFIETNQIITLEDLENTEYFKLQQIWKNRRSWHMAKSIASYLGYLKKDKNLNDKEAFLCWARSSQLENWHLDPIGQINGVGLTSYQYLRMMGGIDTVMPDKIVKRVISNILSEANIKLPKSDLEFIYLMDDLARETGYRPIELCWMTWLIQSESNLARMEKYSKILSKI